MTDQKYTAVAAPRAVDAIREALRLCREQTAEINAGRLEALK